MDLAATILASTAAAGEDHGSLAWLLAGATAIVTVLAWLAQRSRAPYPVFLVLAGTALGFVPGLPDVTLDPDLVFLVFLPPLIYAAAYFTSLHELRSNIRSISMLAVGLVFVTMVVVAAVAHAVAGLSWPVAFVLGAIVSPTDPVAGAAVLERMRVPRRVVNIVEGESLINDGSGIVLYRVAVAAVVSGTFSAVDAGLEFLVSCAGGVGIGILAGMVATWLRRRNEHGPTDVLLSVASGYLAYLPAEALHVSGVLATVTVGIWLGWRTPTIVRNAETRIQIEVVWVNATFLINSALFLIVGLQLRDIVARLDGTGPWTLAWYAAAVSIAVLASRLAFVFPATFLLRLTSGSEIRDPRTTRIAALVGWIGMRGSVSLAAALALPTTIEGGGPFPDRDLVVFLAFSVIVVTLVVQGMSLGRVVEWLGLEDDGDFERSEARARMVAARAALTRIDELHGCGWIHDAALDRLRTMYAYRERRFESRVLEDDEAELYDERADAWVRLARELREAERAALLELRSTREITDEVLSAVQRDLDLEDIRVR
ncbi:MAG: Na+/H+ antiporter [Thermoleophilia bacterium]|nr:Na+/H+ antiporter [Thermoleophilia bacterium]